jgi:hypothetical protein
MTDRLWADLELGRLDRAGRAGPLARRPARPTPFVLGHGAGAGAGKFFPVYPRTVAGDERAGATVEWGDTDADPLFVVPLNSASTGGNLVAVLVDYRWATDAVAGTVTCLVTLRLLQCCKTPIAGATVTAVKGAFSVSGTTDRNGYVNLDITGGGPGVYTITSVHGGLTSVETDTLDCGSLVLLDGGCFVDAFVIDCCGYHVTGATVTVKQGSTVIGSATVAVTGPVTAAPSVAIPVPNAGSYTVECDDPCVTSPSQTVVVPHCPAPVPAGVVRFRQDSSPPTSLTDPLGNTIALTAGKGSHTYTVDLTSLPSYPGTGFGPPGCQFVPPILIDRPYGTICDEPGAYETTADITLGFSASRCGLWVIVPLCPGFNPLQCWTAILRANFDPGTDVSGGCDNIAVPLMASGEGGFGTGTGQCCPYVGEGSVNFAPTAIDVDNWCNFTNTRPDTAWLLTALFGDSGDFTTTA